ncbi:hypothetical protein B9G55_06300 [Saccharibacillus sp. O16]|nr:hypothetical protein B9G55_06300 [Saccharibacillus sp. O16]
METNEAKRRIKEAVRDMFSVNFKQPPGIINVLLDERALVIHLEDFVGSDIQQLVDTKDPDALRSVQELLTEHLLPRLKTQIEPWLGEPISFFYYDWEDHDLSGVIVALRSPADHTTSDYPGRIQLHRQMDVLTCEIEKIPDYTYSFWPAPNTLVLIREGILIKLEKEFIEQGAGDILRIVKRKLEKREIAQSAHLEEILQRKLKAFYLDWWFEQDKSVLVCIFEEAEAQP